MKANENPVSLFHGIVLTHMHVYTYMPINMYSKYWKYLTRYSIMSYKYIYASEVSSHMLTPFVECLWHVKF